MILGALFISSLDGSDPIKKIMNKNYLTRDYINSGIDYLLENSMLESDKKTLTAKGRASLKVVLAGGVFDIIHPGHIYTLNSAKDLGNVLVVVVATDKTALKMKKRIPLHDQMQRKNLVDSLYMVDVCLIGNETDIFKTVDKVRPQIIALGYDQMHQKQFIVDGCKKIHLDVTVARLESFTPEISSSKIEKEYGKDIHGL